MAHGRRNTPDPEERGPAPSDLLQMWINGRTSPATDAEPASDTDGAEPDAVDSDAVDSHPVEADAEPEAAEAEVVEPDVVEAQPDTVDEPEPPEASEEPEADQGAWWPSDVEAAAETDDLPEEPSQWWPYEPTAADQDLALGQSVEDAPETETETDAQDAQPESPGPTPVQSNQKLASREAAADRARGWASFGVAPTAEDVLDQIGTRGVWPDHTSAPPPIVPPPRPSAETDEPGPTEPPEPVAPEPPRARRELDMSSTAHWTLDDFEEYIRVQTGNEPAEWIGEPATDEAEQPDAGDPVEVAVDVPVEAVQAPAEVQSEDVTETIPAEVDEAEEPTADEPDEPQKQARASAGKDHGSRGVRGLLARMGLTREPEPPEEPTPLFPAVVSPPSSAPPVSAAEPEELPTAPLAATPEQVPTSPELADETSWVAAEQEWSEADVEWVEPVSDDPDASSQVDAAEPAEVAEQPAGHDLVQPAYDPDETAYFDWTAADFEGLPPGTAAAAPVEEPEPVAETPLWVDPGSAHDDDPDQDHQEWYDDSGLKWVSDDGGYTWFSTDGQGWNAEIGEPIDVPVVSPAASVGTPQTSDAPGETDQPPWPQGPTELDEHDVWPAASSSPPTVDHETSSEYWPDRTEPGEAELLDGTTGATLAQSPAAETTSLGAKGADASQQLPQFVEYKPRGAYRPLLGALFVAAAIVAVIAIFWAVSKGSQAATGIAAGVTGFALAFWWGLLSWTPTVVSVDGSTLEVARGAEGERFDLRDPALMIEQDADPTSRNWRTTITRSNGTELVIPASAVDPVEFTSIVQHYRDEAGRSPRTDTRT